MNTILPKTRVAGIFFDFKNRNVLLMYRYRANMGHYYCGIGGGVEDNEDLLQALSREIYEEANLHIENAQMWIEYKNPDNKNQEYFYIINKFSGEIKLGEPELSLLSPQNIFAPRFVNFSQISGLNILPPILKTKIMEKIHEN